MLHFQWSIFYILFNAPQNINEYHYIWGSDLREIGLKGFGLARVYCYFLLLLSFTTENLFNSSS